MEKSHQDGGGGVHSHSNIASKINYMLYFLAVFCPINLCILDKNLIISFP